MFHNSIRAALLAAAYSMTYGIYRGEVPEVAKAINLCLSVSYG